MLALESKVHYSPGLTDFREDQMSISEQKNNDQQNVGGYIK